MVKRLALRGSVFEKKTQTKDEEKHAQECIEILFEPKKTEHYGSFIRCEYGTRMNFKKYVQLCHSTGYFNMALNASRIFLEE
jgi:hypothetical protein